MVRAKIVDLTPVSASSSPNRTNRIRISGRLGVFKQPEGVHLPVNLEFQMSCDCPIVKAAVTRSNGPGRWLLMGKLDASKKTVTVSRLRCSWLRSSSTFMSGHVSHAQSANPHRRLRRKNSITLKTANLLLGTEMLEFVETSFPGSSVSWRNNRLSKGSI